MEKEIRDKKINNRKCLVFALFAHELNPDSTIEEFCSEGVLELDDNLKKVYNDVLSKLSIIDGIISSVLENYTLDRLSTFDRNLIRYATYELKYKKMNSKVVINEALELTKEYSELDDKLQHKFNNKLLDSIANKLLS